ncbi:hypothetical protein [Kitasatospora sp. NBC_01266]|uniref:hypothetical protein n=1 Tax=Kitasatospora sp. NBC_01266 TaxID=2903572 RepID=UPI002E325061|nr:hypothetical protein [Kitasatospora sp. NBC_01266]
MTERTDRYFAELAGGLRAAGLPQSEVAATVADLGGYLAESGSPDPYEEFGAPEDFAARLTRRPGADERPDASAQTWKWAADIYTDRKYLNHYGDQGWEVAGLDRLGRFVCHRDPASAMRWEYRRESADRARGLAAIAAELAPEGWEPCGRFLYFMYLKRPKAASAGPAAGLDELVPPPGKRLFVGRTTRSRLREAVLGAVLGGVVACWATHVGGSRMSLVALAVAAVLGPIGLANGWRRMKREVRAGAEDA